MILVLEKEENLVGMLDSLGVYYTETVLMGNAETIIARVNDTYTANLIMLAGQMQNMIDVDDYHNIFEHISTNELVEYIDNTIKNNNNRASIYTSLHPLIPITYYGDIAINSSNPTSIVVSITVYGQRNSLELCSFTSKYLLDNGISNGVYDIDATDGLIIYKALLLNSFSDDFVL